MKAKKRMNVVGRTESDDVNVDLPFCKNIE